MVPSLQIQTSLPQTITNIEANREGPASNLRQCCQTQSSPRCYHRWPPGRRRRFQDISSWRTQPRMEEWPCHAPILIYPLCSVQKLEDLEVLYVLDSLGKDLSRIQNDPHISTYIALHRLQNIETMFSGFLPRVLLHFERQPTIIYQMKCVCVCVSNCCPVYACACDKKSIHFITYIYI